MEIAPEIFACILKTNFVPTELYSPTTATHDVSVPFLPCAPTNHLK